MVRTVLAALLLALLALPTTGAAHAGASAAEADFSGSPGLVRVALSAPVEREGLRASIVLDGLEATTAIRRDPADPAGLLIALSDLRPPAQEVTWRALSRDGHVSRGRVRVEAPGGLGHSGQTQVLDAGADPDRVVVTLGRGLALAGILIVLGLIIFDLLVLAPAWREGGVRPPASPLGADTVRRAAGGALRAGRRAWWRAWYAALALAAIGVVLWGTSLSASLDIGPGALGGTRAGAALATVALATIIGALAGAAIARRQRPPGPLGGPAGLALALPALVALAALSWGGHAATGPAPGLDIVVDLAHSVATAAWLGGLAGLALALGGPVTAMAGRARTALAAALVVRFSALAMVAVGALIVTGIYRALAELEALADLATTGYGRWLMAKLALFVVMLAVAGVNRFVLHVRLERAALGLATDDRGAGAALRRSVAAELGLSAAVLVAVAGLIASAPPT